MSYCIDRNEKQTVTEIPGETRLHLQMSWNENNLRAIGEAKKKRKNDKKTEESFANDCMHGIDKVVYNSISCCVL